MSGNYKLADIAMQLKEDGTKIFTVTYAGWHLGQGGMDFGEGSYGFQSMEDALNFYKMKFEKDEEYLTNFIKDKENDKK